jgi:DNA-binding transcriptional LysR family regulator
MAGRFFLDEAKATLEQAEQAVQLTRRVASGEAGELHIGLSPSALFLPIVSQTVARFRELYPELRLEMSEQSLSAQRDSVAERRLDIGLIRSGRPPILPDTVEAKLLAFDRLYAAIPKGHRLRGSGAPIDVADLAGEAIVHYPYDREGFEEGWQRLFASA